MGKYKIKFKANDKSGFAKVPDEIRVWMRENKWEPSYAEELVDEICVVYKKTIITTYNSEVSYVKLTLAIPFNEKDKSTVYKINQDNDYLRFTNEELKFFDAMNFDLSEIHMMETGQDITDWFK